MTTAKKDPVQISLKLAAGRMKAAKWAPFLQRGVNALIFIEDERITVGGEPTFAVTPDFRMRYHPDAVTGWSADQIGAVLLHEVSHVLRDHYGRMKRLAVPRSHAALWNLAGDMGINGDLADMRVPLPGDGVYHSTFGFPPGLTTEAYYHLLVKQATPHKSKPCQGQCGSGAGHAADGESSPGKGDTKAEGNNAGAVGAKGAGDGEAGRSPADVARIKQGVAQDIQTAAANKRGTVPGGWQSWAGGVLKPAVVRWQDRLSRVLRGAVNQRAGLKDYSYRRPSRRQGAFGWGSGVPILPAMRATTPRVAVGLDTSGSMAWGGRKTSPMALALAEVQGLLSAVDAEVSFVACDAAVHVNKKIKRGTPFAGLVVGGGGTSFIPAFDAVSSMRPRPDVFVFLTDGDGEAPADPPPGVKVIWVLCGENKTDPGVPWGDRISIE